MTERGTAVVTGASSGFGAATAIRLAAEGFAVVLGGRREDRLAEVAARCGDGARSIRLDVTDPDSVAAFADEVGPCRVLINNAGGALGLDRIEDAVEQRWRWMYDVNVLGPLRMTKALLPALEASGDGHVVNVGSLAGIDPYVGGAGYNVAKTGEHVLTEVLRRELLGRPIRVSEVLPGMAETEFSMVRFGGDAERAAKVYEGAEPLTAEDVADVIAFVVTRPPHVNLATTLLLCRDQATSTMVHRRPPPASGGS